MYLNKACAIAPGALIECCLGLSFKAGAGWSSAVSVLFFIPIQERDLGGCEEEGCDSLSL